MLEETQVSGFWGVVMFYVMLVTDDCQLQMLQCLSTLFHFILLLAGIDYYSCALPALIADWRTKFQQPELAFGAILLAPWTNDGSPW